MQPRTSKGITVSQTCCGLKFPCVSMFCHHLLHLVLPSTQHTPTTGGGRTYLSARLLYFVITYYILFPLPPLWWGAGAGGGGTIPLGGEGPGTNTYIYNIYIYYIYITYKKYACYILCSCTPNLTILQLDPFLCTVGSILGQHDCSAEIVAVW